uniref:ABC transporter domain-containing protein n=1 Tax=Polytomella parva TaxID=51329 RepID=A0A6U0YCP6_9CHLO|mmetsp:Transcript_4461/g.7964  ORF Transcript_4461/g.7964 Transcript_4461/m.7964 type:complete len:1424 (+) Transcript_4461:201-4472(+)
MVSEAIASGPLAESLAMNISSVDLAEHEQKGEESQSQQSPEGGLKRLVTKFGSSISLVDLDAEKVKQSNKDLVKLFGENNDNDQSRIAKFVAERLARVGLSFPAIEVRFKNVSVEAQIPVKEEGKIPNIVNTFVDACKMVVNMAVPILKTHPFKVVNNASGVLRPGRMCLMVGPPASGRSTLMKALCGQVTPKTNRSLHMTGDVSYNGLTPHKDFVIESTASYFDQRDQHIAEMTVEETIAFACQCLGTKPMEAMYKVMREREIAAGLPIDDKELDEMWRSSFHSTHSIMVDVVASMMGIDHVRMTVVGDELLKGISGGQKRRVTSAEMAVGMHQVLFMDEISTGLDSATTFSIMKSFKNFCRYSNLTVLCTLLQPSPQVFELFDDIVLMSQGRIVFQGPREDIVPFFNSLNFFCPPQMSEPDFLQEITNSFDQHKFYVVPPSGEPYKYKSPRQIQKLYEQTPQWKNIQAALETPTLTHPMQDIVLHKNKYAISEPRMFTALMKREALLLKRGWIFILAGMIQTLLVAFFVSTSFVNQHKRNFTDANAFLGVNFFSLMVMLLGGFNNIPIYCKRLPVFYKQRDNNFYHAWWYAINASLVRFPEYLINGTTWSIMVYFSVGFIMERGRFFIYWLNMVLACAIGCTLTQSFGALTRHEIITQGICGLLLLILVSTAGYSIARTSIRGWWIWMYWINPLTYTMTSLSVNEFLSEDWKFPATAYNSTEAFGLYVLKYRGFFHSQKWVWIGIGAQFGFVILLVVVQALFLQYLPSPVGAFNPILPDEGEDEDEDGNLKEAAVVAIKERKMGEELRASMSPRTTTLAFTPMSMTFRDINYFVPKPGATDQSELQLLNRVSGCFRPGVLTALMGASGAGKTTLMDVLANRKTGGRTEGEQLVNGHPKEMKTFARVMGYVEQVDVHMPQTTVKEALLFSARIRLSSDTSRETIYRYCEEIMTIIELNSLSNHLVGSIGDGLSVEQRKRLTIGVELVANPSIVFMDEPTSGLDGRAASLVMRAVKNTVNAGRTVVCTIHQPSKEIVLGFDELLLLKPGGRTIYFGPVGKDFVDLVAYFELYPVERFDPFDNPANWMLEVTSGPNEKTLNIDFSDAWEASKLNVQATALIDQYSDLATHGNAPKLSFDSVYAQSFVSQLYLILERQFTCYWRNPVYNLLRFGATFAIGMMFGTLFWAKGNHPDSILGLLNIMGALFAACLYLGMCNILVILPVVNADRVVYYRERASGMYSCMAYALAQGFVEQPYLLAQSIFYVIMIYFQMHFFFTATKFFWFFLYVWFNLLTFTSFGMAFMNVFPAVQLAMAGTAPFMLLWNLYCGFLIYKNQIHPWWIWMYYLSPATYSIYGCVVTQLGDLKDVFVDTGSSVMSVAQYVEETFTYKYEWRGWLILILLGFVILFRAISCFGLWYFKFQVR